MVRTGGGDSGIVHVVTCHIFDSKRFGFRRGTSIVDILVGWGFKAALVVVIHWHIALANFEARAAAVISSKTGIHVAHLGVNGSGVLNIKSFTFLRICGPQSYSVSGF